MVDLAPTVDAEPISWPRSVTATFFRDDDWYGKLAGMLHQGVFAAAPLDAVELISAATQRIARAFIALDHLVDGDDPANVVTLALGCVALQYEGLESLYRIFPPEHAFWARFRELCGAHSRGVIAEASWNGGVLPAAASVLDAYRDKNALHRGVIAAMACASGARDEDYSALAGAMDAFALGLQLTDDVHDWRANLASDTPTYLNAQHDFLARHRRGEAVARLDQELYFEGVVDEALERAADQHGGASRTATEFGLTRWAAFIDGHRRAAANLLAALDHARRRLTSARVRTIVPLRPATSAELGEPVAMLVARVLEQFTGGFGELQHLMYFPPEGGFTGERPLKRGDLFQRLLVLDALRLTLPAGEPAFCAYAAAESEYVTASAMCDPLGHRTWSYFSDLPELPPDLDDLAELMRLAAALPELAPLRADIDVNLAQIRSVAGTPVPSTWLVPRSGDALHTRQAEFVTRCWGERRDIEVVANYLGALAAYAPASPDAPRLLAAVVAAQKRDGTFDSTWYHGPFYGTYAVLRALDGWNALDDFPDAVASAVRFLERSRGAGGWGIDAAPDRLSTAFALLALVHAKVATPNDATSDIVRTLTDYHKPAVPFIKMVLPTAPPRTMSYESRTLEDALAAKALRSVATA